MDGVGDTAKKTPPRLAKEVVKCERGKRGGRGGGGGSKIKSVKEGYAYQ